MALSTSYLALPGQTGNNTHQSVGLTNGAQAVCVEFRVTAIGATPTVTYIIQGSMDEPTVADASSNWNTVLVYPVGSDTGTAAPSAVTTVSSALHFFGVTRFFKKVRIVTSANTNVTYEAKLHEQLPNK